MIKQITLLLCFLPFCAFAQLQTPAASPTSVVSQQVGLTQFSITYSRPSVKARKIFGELVPYGKVWRTGANEATLLNFDQEITIGETAVPAGNYALFTIPGEEEWTWILNTATDSWGAYTYNETKNVVSFSTKPTTIPRSVQSMEFRWMNIKTTTVDLVMEWENVRATLPIQLATHKQVEMQIADQLNEEASSNDYYAAAKYYLDNDLDLNLAQQWMAKSMATDEDNFRAMRYQALIEHKLGNNEVAQKIMERSLELAQASKNQTYTNLNTQSLAGWNKQTVNISAADILARSITYHDPQNTWNEGVFDFQLYESRPGGGYRFSEMTIDNNASRFSILQRRDRDLIERAIGPDGCVLKLNGETDFSDEDKERLRLNCDFNTMYSNYYSYLWGLPMKLTDQGTIVHPQAHKVDFFGEELYEIKVTYTPEVGDDIWYFYFDTSDFKMRGYRFYHDEAANDGEFILLEEEATVGTIKIPAKRSWYTHKGRRFLGTDEILN